MNIKAIAANNRATATDRQATAICIKEIAIDRREIAANRQEMPTNIEEISTNSPEMLARNGEIAANDGFAAVSAKSEHKTLQFSTCRTAAVSSQSAPMNLRISNQLNMVGACINIANSADYKPVWNGKEPADFGTDIANLQTNYAAVTAKAAQADSATGGGGDAKAAAETALEDAAYVLARALANHFKKTGDLERLGKVDLSKTEIVKLRTQDLVNKATAIRDLGTAAAGEPGAAGRGVTAARIAALTAAITNFSKVMNAPRGEVVNRSALLREVETDVAALVEAVSDLDDLVVQFDGTEAGRRFIEAWKRARIIVDSGTGRGNGSAQPAPAKTPTPPPQ